MITFQQAVSNVKKQFPQCFVTSGFEFDGKFCFSVLSKNYRDQPMDAQHYYCVDKQTGEVLTFDWKKAIEKVDRFTELRDNATLIDEVL